MGNYSVPESIREYKPRGTMVKVISGHYYVYEYSTVRDGNGKRHTKMGKSIGTIKEGIGFIPNNGLICDSEVSTLEFGDYAVVLANSPKTFELLNECFNPEDAVRTYVTAMIHFIQGFAYMKDIRSYYEMSVLSLKYPSFKLGYDALSSLYDNLGRRQGSVLHMEEALEITQGAPDVRVGVIDTGIAEHGDLLNVAEGYDFYNEDSVTTDDETGHGTHVAGTIAAAVNNGLGVAGVVPNVTLVPLQACYDNDGNFWTSDLIEDISYATEQWGTDDQISVLNYSISGFEERTAVLSAVLDFPGLFVCAAGNGTTCVDDYDEINQYDADNLI